MRVQVKASQSCCSPHATEVRWYPNLFLLLSAESAMAAASALDCPRTFGVDIDLLIFAAFEPAEIPWLFPGDDGFI